MNTAQRQNLLELDREGLECFFVETLDEKRFRAHQVMKWIHHRHVTDFGDMTDLGFKVLYMERMSPLEQMSLWASARMIVPYQALARSARTTWPITVALGATQLSGCSSGERPAMDRMSGAAMSAIV